MLCSNCLIEPVTPNEGASITQHHDAICTSKGVACGHAERRIHFLGVRESAEVIPKRAVHPEHRITQARVFVYNIMLWGREPQTPRKMRSSVGCSRPERDGTSVYSLDSSDTNPASSCFHIILAVASDGGRGEPRSAELSGNRFRHACGIGISQHLTGNVKMVPYGST